MSIRNKIFIAFILACVLPLGLVAVTVFPFHRHDLTTREVSLMSASARNRADRAAAVLRAESQETLQQIADQIPAFGESPEVLIFSRDAAGHFTLATKPRYEPTRSPPYGDMQRLLTESFQDAEAHEATLNDQRGVTTVAVARRVGETDHAVIVKEDLSEILYPNYVLRDYFLVISFIAIALAALLALLLARTVTGPLLTLARTVSTFKTDKPDRIEVHGNDEVSALAKSFRDMWERLKDYNAELEKAVWKRTAELDEANRAMEGSNAVLAARLEEIEKLTALMVGREMTMVEMKEELKKLKENGEKKAPT